MKDQEIKILDDLELDHVVGGAGGGYGGINKAITRFFYKLGWGINAKVNYNFPVYGRSMNKGHGYQRRKHHGNRGKEA